MGLTVYIKLNPNKNKILLNDQFSGKDGQIEGNEWTVMDGWS